MIEDSAIQRLGSEEIREIFLRYFESKDHQRIRGSSLLPENDPTLLFINSGMAPLKPYFTGVRKPPHPDLCNVQPCIRTTDIEDVGDRHHLTLFEMLGSWSIGHYFKDRAVELAYELLVEKFRIPKSRLYVSVYAGNPALGLEPDQQSARAWERVGIPSDRIVFLGEDNFWGPAGDAGPCGPCTEVFFDTGDQYGAAYRPGGEFDTKKRYIEIWNAGVFMELDKKPDGSFVPLPFQSVDTGSGVERMAMVLQGASSVYETDLFADLMSAVRAALPAGTSVEACRTMADHVRASCFILSERVLPGNTGRAYIPRRLIRKCVALAARAGRSGFPYAELIDLVVGKLGPHYQRLVQARQLLSEAFLREATDFEAVIASGLERLERLCNQKAPFVISGRDAFNLFATYGLPVEITREFLKERGGSIDEADLARQAVVHQETSRGRADARADEWTGEDDVARALPNARPSDFVGYRALACDATVLGLASQGEPLEVASEGARVELLADKTPFYAEGGGQVGDRGEIRAPDGLLKVLDTQKIGGMHLHRAEVLSGSIRVGEKVGLAVDEETRRATMRNHSATHLLNAALREVLGPHVRQAGSHVDAERLRFDFGHPKGVTREELAEIERRVAEKIQDNHEREVVLTTYTEAVNAGALAFSGETYGDEVRMVRFGGASTELCGGTHVHATGDIGQFRIVSEASVASGVRRIVAITGKVAVRHTLEQERILREVAAQLSSAPADLPAKVAEILKSKAAAQKPAARTESVDAKGRTQTSASGLPYFAARMNQPMKLLQQEALRIASEIGGVAVLVGEDEGSARLAIAVDKQQLERADARPILKALLPLIEGKGGGSPHLGQGGGPRLEGIDAVLASVAQHVP
jgi:alanyl-tRNA synthetase